MWLYRFKIVICEVELQIVIHEAKSNPVEPAGPPEQIPVDVLIGEEIDHRFNFQPENLKLNRVAKSFNPSRSGPESFRVTSLNLEIQQIRMFTLKEAIARTGIDKCEYIDTFPAVRQDHRQRYPFHSGRIGALVAEFEARHSEPACGRPPRLVGQMNKKRTLHSFGTSFVAHDARFRPMADEFAAMQRDPLPGIEGAMIPDPFLFLRTSGNRVHVRQIGDRHEHMLTFIER